MTNKTVHWSRRVGEFLDPETGEVLSVGNRLTTEMSTQWFTPQEWYLTLTEVINGHAAHDQTKIFTSRDIQTILECLPSYRPRMAYDASRAYEINSGMTAVAELVSNGVSRLVFITESSPNNEILIFNDKGDATTILVKGMLF